jgi:hypothetical protein
MYWQLAASLASMFAAGVSLGLGTQALALFVNNRSRRNFWLNLLLSGVVYVAAWLLWAGSIWALGRLLFQTEPSLEQMVRLVALAITPYYFGFLALVPYLGIGVQRLLTTLTLIGVVAAVAVAAQTQLWRALVATAGGWLVLLLVQRLLNRPVAFLGGRLWEPRTALEARLDVDDLVVLPEGLVG